MRNVFWEIGCTVMLCLFAGVSFADGMTHPTVYGYNGYITVPSAYISDAHLGLHYAFIPSSAAPFHTDNSNNQVYTANLGLFPFLECHLSVYVSPSIRWIGNTGADKTRSAGVKVRLLKEKRLIPAVAIGMHDPRLEDIGATTYQQISSSFCVASKRFADDRVSVSAGYGFSVFEGTYDRLDRFFFGLSYSPIRYITCLADYSDQDLFGGISVQILPVNLALLYVGDETLAYRFSYRIKLL